MRRLSSRVIATFVAAVLAMGTGAGVATAAPTKQPTDVDFRAIVKLSNCSGSVFRFADSSDTAKALVLTNGHCIGRFIDPGEVVSEQPSSRTFELLDTTGQGTLGTLTAESLQYATMTGTDVAVYRLKETYGDIETKYDTEALTLSEGHPVAGTDIKVVSGYWRKIYSCGIDGFVYKLKEADWTWNDSIRYTPGCDTIGGTSGSPVVDTATEKIVGVNNTAYEGDTPCSLNNPCEVDRAGNVTVVPEGRYGQETYKLRVLLRRAGVAA